MKLDCNCNDNISNFNNSYWENRGVTTDELDIINYLLKKKYNFHKKNILHIGIGNSYIAEKLSTFKCRIVGITISKNEINFAKLKKIKNYRVLLINKYSKKISQLNKIKKFDLIIDANLKSYACCDNSFDFLFYKLNSFLLKNSLIITSRRGMRWSKILKRTLNFSLKKFFYFKLKEINGPKKNILTLNDCKNIAKKYNFLFYYNKKIAFFKKNKLKI